MRRLMLMLLASASLSACATTPNDAGLCAGLKPLASDHAKALLADGGDQSVVTGERLLAGLDAGCGR